MLLLPHVHDALLESWFSVKEALEKLDEDVMPYTDYEALCNEHSVTDAQDQAILLRYLHDLGIMLNYDDPDTPYNLRNTLQATNVLNPEWVTTGIYDIITNTQLSEEGGILEVSQLSNILKNPKKHPPARHPFILGMMEKFELCFDFTGTRGQKHLIPELLKKNRTDIPWPNEGTLNFEYHYEVLPSSVLSRFIVRQHHNLTEHPTYWRYGVVLEIDSCRALVRSDETDAKIFVSIKDGTATGRRGALAVIRNEFRAILATIPRLVYDERVPLPGFPGKTASYEHLLWLEEDGQEFYSPEGVRTKISVSELLNGVVDQEVREKERNQSITNITKYEHCNFNNNSRSFTGSNTGQASMGDQSPAVAADREVERLYLKRKR